MNKKFEYNDLSSWRMHDITVKGKDVFELDLLDTLPNQFIVQNPNDEVLLIGLAKIPTGDNYEYDIPKNVTKAIGRPIRSNKMYILNTGGNPVNVKIFSVYKEFDIACLASSSFNIDHAEIKTDGIVNGFKSGVSLPKGSNLIGKVDVNNYATLIEQLNEMQTSHHEFMRTGIEYNTRRTAESLLDAVEKLTSLSNDLLGVKSNMLLPLTVEPIYHDNYTGMFTYMNQDKKVNVHFEWLMNDSDSDASIQVNNKKVLTIKKGEKMCDFNIELNPSEQLTLFSANPLFRIKYYIVERV